jgi:DNA polymerase I-like protein with 3'-5' exonuclease and polymerase domains
MKPLDPVNSLDRALLHITQEEAIPIIEDFCDEYSPGQVRDYLEQAFNTALIHDDRNNLAGRREDFLIWYQRTKRLLEAVFAIRQFLEQHPELGPRLRA